jgi:hypothetical protein
MALRSEIRPTEHVMVPKATARETRDVRTLILAAVSKKQEKGGPAYARGKVLVVFLDVGLGEWSPNQVARQLPKVDFKEVWVVGLHGEVTDEYVYGVTQLDMSRRQRADLPRTHQHDTRCVGGAAPTVKF